MFDQMAITSLKSMVFRKIEHKYCMIGTKLLKNGGEMGEKYELEA